LSSQLEKARGVLRPQLAQGRFEHERRPPSASLAHLVEHYWHVRWDLRGLPPQQQATLPHPNVHLVLEHGQAHLYGVQTARFERQLEGADFVFGIKFKAGAFQPFLGASVSALANRSVPAAEVFGTAGEALAGQVSATANVDAMAQAAESLLLSQLPGRDLNVERVGVLVDAAANDVGLTSVEQLSAMAALDKRALQRLFQKYVGVGPKWVIQRYRLHEAIAQMQCGTPVNWAAFALGLGYFDQAHFVRDFRALVGQAPTEYLRSLAIDHAKSLSMPAKDANA
jgi:AraC-like DNA-binding protein